MGTCPHVGTFDPIDKRLLTHPFPVQIFTGPTETYFFDHGAHAAVPPQHKDNKRIIR